MFREHCVNFRKGNRETVVVVIVPIGAETQTICVWKRETDRQTDQEGRREGGDRGRKTHTLDHQSEHPIRTTI